MPGALHDGGIFRANCTRDFGGQGARARSAFGSQSAGVTRVTSGLCKNNYRAGRRIPNKTTLSRPTGEGTASSPFAAFKAVGYADRWRTILPLPFEKGEGQGEG